MTESNARSACLSMKSSYSIYKAIQSESIITDNNRYQRILVVATRGRARCYLREFVRCAQFMLNHVNATDRSDLLRAIRMILEGADDAQPVLTAQEVQDIGHIDEEAAVEDILKLLKLSADRIFYALRQEWAPTDCGDQLLSWAKYIDGTQFWYNYGQRNFSPERPLDSTS